MKTMTDRLTHMDTVRMRFGALTSINVTSFVFNTCKTTRLKNPTVFSFESLNIAFPFCDVIDRDRLVHPNTDRTDSGGRQKRMCKWMRGPVDKWRFQVSSAKLVSKGSIPSPVVLAHAFLT